MPVVVATVADQTAGLADRTGGRVLRVCNDPGSRTIGLAIGAPFPIIRHRFGGHLRAA